MISKDFNPLDHPVCLDFPIWMEKTAWAEHIPFGMYLISAFRPKTFVELGTYHGVSYFAFCQAVKALNLNAKCYAVDTWQGDEHAGKIEKSILPKLEEHNSSFYSDFSQLLQKTFDEAQKDFADGSIDLLHIDGFHTYEAVRHDFENWLPKMSDRGIVLFHDVNVRERDFGVYKLWDELCKNYKNFTFLHGYGLGVLAVGGETPENLKHLFDVDEKETKLLQHFFHQYGMRIEAVNDIRSSEYIKYLDRKEGSLTKRRLANAYRILKEKGISGLLGKVKEKINEPSK